MGFREIDRKWLIIAILIVLALTLFGLYYFFLRPPSTITGILWKRTGGIAGLDETLKIESDGALTLSSNLLGDKEFMITDNEWNNLVTLIKNSGFIEFEELFDPKTGVADFFTYSLTIEKGSTIKKVVWVDDWASKKEQPEELREIEKQILALIHGKGQGGIEGIVTDEIRRSRSGLVVSIIDGSVGFPEIAVITDDIGFYKIGNVPPGIFTLGVHNEDGDLIGKGTAFVRGGEKTTLDIVVSGSLIYDYYGGLGIFEKGIHVIATDFDPWEKFRTTESEKISDFWSMLKNEIALEASSSDFISILISRGDFNTGGYLIQIKSHVWLDSFPIVCKFSVNFTDPGEGVPVTEAFTHPLVLVPIGNLSSGKYVTRAHINSFIFNFDQNGKPIFTPIKTLVEEVWEKEFEIS
jgi:hypothetical protein